MTQKTESKTVRVFVNRRKVELEAGSLTAAELLARASFEGTEWEILLLQGEGDPSGGEPLLADQAIELRPGMHFRVLPGNRTFGLARRWRRR